MVPGIVELIDIAAADSPDGELSAAMNCQAVVALVQRIELHH